MTNIFKWWNNLNPLTTSEKEILNFKLCHDFNIINKVDYILPKETSIENWNLLVSEYFNRMPDCNCSIYTHHLSFEVSATTFIDALFNKYVDNDTLVISTDSEHPNVKFRLNTCKNLITLSLHTDILSYNLNKLQNKIIKYKKVFVYIIGTRNNTGEITPQLFLKKLKEILIKNNIEYKFILDDVQGMFLVPRDYSLFDYVIGTAHAIVDGFDMGILISKTKEFGKEAYNWGSRYLESLDIILKRKDKMFLFKQICIQYFNKYNSIIPYFITDDNVPYIYYFKTNNIYISKELAKTLSKYNLLVSDISFSCDSFIQMRCHKFIKDETLLDKAILVIDYLLKNNTINEEYVYSILKD